MNIHTSLPRPDTPQYVLESGPPPRGAAPPTTAAMFSSEARGPPATRSGPGARLCRAPASARGLTALLLSGTCRQGGKAELPSSGHVYLATG